MINKSVDEAVFDTVLAKAFADAAMEDIKSEKLNETDSPVTLSARHLKMQRRAYKKYEAQRADSASRYTALRRIAACILIVGTIGFISVFTIPTVRAAVVDAVIDFFDKYMCIDFGDGDPTSNSAVQIGDFTASYIPEGFELTDSDEKKTSPKYKFENPQTKEYFQIKIAVLNGRELQYDYENAKYNKISVNGYPAFIIKLENDDKNISLVFSNEANTITVYGNILEEEIICIASGIN